MRNVWNGSTKLRRHRRKNKEKYEESIVRKGICTMTRFKLFLQNLWKKTNTWDQSINQEDAENWNSLISEWPTKLEEFPRCATNSPGQIQIHVFTNASQLAYAAAVYMRNQGIQRTGTSLVFARSRIAPVKRVTSLRLELLAVFIGI